MGGTGDGVWAGIGLSASSTLGSALSNQKLDINKEKPDTVNNNFFAMMLASRARCYALIPAARSHDY